MSQEAPDGSPSATEPNPSAPDDAGYLPEAAEPETAEDALGAREEHTQMGQADGSEANITEESAAQREEEARAKAQREKEDEEAAALRLEIAAVRRQIAEAKAKNDAIADEAAAANLQAETVKRELKEANDQNNTLIRDLAAAEKTRQEVLPQYERCKQNHELKERAELLRNEILEEEAKVKRLEARDTDLKKQLAEASALYKAERGVREAFEARLADHVVALLDAVDFKVKETVAEDEDSADYVDPHGLLDVCLDLVRTREDTMRSITKQARELEAVCAMQREAVQELDVACRNQIKAFTMSKDEEIRELIFALQDERNALLCDIDEINRVNQDQKLHLQKGLVQRATSNRGVIRPAAQSAGPRSDARSLAARPTELRRPVDPPEEVKLLIAKNRELTTELTQLKAALSKKMSDRTEEVKAAKVLEAQIKEERKQYSIALNRLEANLGAELAKREAMELENSRLAEAIEHLSGTLKSTKKHIENVRGKTLPLPIE
jgi:hypothetical protein